MFGVRGTRRESRRGVWLSRSCVSDRGRPRVPRSCGRQLALRRRAGGLFDEGVALLGTSLEDPRPDLLTDLAVDYARVFLGAGIPDGKAAYPFESVYTSPERLIMQDARDEVLSIYRAHGVGKSEAWGEPEDHLALELELMGYLCHKGAEVARSGEKNVLLALVRDQLDFVRGHLLRWVPTFCRDVEHYAETNFYRAVAKMTCGFLEADESFLADVLDEGV